VLAISDDISDKELQMSNRSSATVRRWATALLVAAMGVVGSASATLLDRGPNMVYDTVLDITWTRQAGDGVARDWATSVAWAGLGVRRIPRLALALGERKRGCRADAGGVFL
jgi:hypothetical protein